MKLTRMLLFALLAALSGCQREKVPEGIVAVSGRIEGDTVDLSSKLAGRVVEITVREGDTVQSGQVVARLESPQDQARREEAQARVESSLRRLEQLRLQLPTFDERLRQARLVEGQAEADAPARVAQSEANVAAARAELARAEADLEQTRNDAARYAQLAAKGAVAVQLAEQYQTRVKTAQAAVEAVRKQVAAAEAGVVQARSLLQNPRIRAAERATVERQRTEVTAQIAGAQAEVEASRAVVERINADLSDLNIRAPISGLVLTRSAEPGRVVAGGQTILSMVDPQKLYLRGFVPEGQIGKVRVGQKAEVSLDSQPQQPLPAEVMRVDPQAMFTPENTYFKEDRVRQVVGVKLLLRNNHGEAKPGMPADGRIDVGR